MWKSYCGKVFVCRSSNALQADHTCDITFGNSGGSFMDSAGYIYGIQSAQYNGLLLNIAVLLNGVQWDNVLVWSTKAV
jgi:S1-C subfamily serine protease